MPIRPAVPEDAPAITALVERAYEHYIPRIGLRPVPMDADHAAAIADHDVFVAHDDQEITGVLVLVTNPDHVLVENVAVDPNRQHQGIGRALLDHAEAFATDHAFAEIRLYTHVLMTENRAIYAAIGYTETGEQQIGERRRVFMTKRLER